MYREPDVSALGLVLIMYWLCDFWKPFNLSEPFSLISSSDFCVVAYWVTSGGKLFMNSKRQCSAKVR